MLVAVVAIWFFKKMRDDAFMRMWRRIFRSHIAAASAVVLAFYIMIALSDSLHFRIEKASANDALQEGEIVSLLDLTMLHRKAYGERTYSAPFATTEYVKSIVVDANGKTTQRRLPLRHVAQDDRFLSESVRAVVIGIFLSLLLIVGDMLYRKNDTLRRYAVSVWRGETEIPWRTAYGMLALLTTVATWMYLMSFSYHVLGTDKVGGDLFYASLKSIRTGVLIGILTTVVTLPLAVFLGVSAGYFRGWVDDGIQYLYTTLSSIPGVLLIAAGVLMMQVMMDNHPDWFASSVERSDLRLLFLIVILGMTSWTGLCRMLRAETLRVAQSDFVVAAKAFGVGKWRIMYRHIVPNLTHIILIAVVLDFSGLVLAEAVLSYVGVGVDPTMYSWGNMINQARLEMAREPMVWWSLFSAFSFMFVLVLAANLFADRIQHVLDPRNA